jgi:acylphosphatase
MQHLDIKVSGRVQGVFFRASTLEQANQIGIKGWVSNHADGSVHIAAEAEPDSMQQFLEWLQHGPANARVDDLDIHPGVLEHFETFSIRRQT